MKFWKDELIDITSHLEASIDFPEDLPETGSPVEMRGRLDRLAVDIQRALKDSELAFLAKRGFKIVLWGKPNVGKSSLLNRLTRSERAIVTPFPGTTRDVVEEEASIGGFPVRFQDTAGIHDTNHPIEKEGVERSKKAMIGADLVLMVMDASQPLNGEDRALLGELREKRVVMALNKSDLPARLGRSDLQEFLGEFSRVISCSCLWEEGTKELEALLLDILSGGKVEMSEEAPITTARQKDLLEKVLKEISTASDSLERSGSPELAAADIRHALTHLGGLAGEVVNEDILEVVFKQFCIGK